MFGTWLRSNRIRSAQAPGFSLAGNVGELMNMDAPRSRGNAKRGNRRPCRIVSARPPTVGRHRSQIAVYSTGC